MPLNYNGVCRIGAYFRQQQEQKNWCWAAVASAVSVYFERKYTWMQCLIVNDRLGRSDCCANGDSVACNKPDRLDEALRIVGHLDAVVSRPYPQVAIHREVCTEGQPLGVRIQWQRTSGGHFVAVTGVIEPDEKVIIEDPWYGYFEMPRADLEQRYQGQGRWTHTYTTV